MNEQKNVRRRPKKQRVNPFTVVIIVALVIIALAGIIVFLSGYRYIDMGNAKYTGFVKNDIPVDGTVKLDNNNTYTIKTNEKTGISTLVYSNGDKYVGEIKGIKRHGDGVFTQKKTELVFEGTFVNDALTGEFTVTDAEGNIKYQGGLMDGEMHGKGEFYGEDGSYYYGDFEYGKRHGAGEQKNPDGTVYIGTFVADKRQGNGTVNVDLSDGSVYTGECKMVFAGGDVYFGDFFNDKMHGNGRYIWAGGAEYKGGFKNGLPEDEDGTYTGADGRSYTGKFVAGQPDTNDVTIPENVNEN